MDISISAVIAQIINFGIMFWLFSKFAAKPLATAIEERRELLHKLKHADDVFTQKVKEAETKAEKIIAEGTATKESIINEASILASKKQKGMVQEAETKAETIIKEAEIRAQWLQKDLEKDFEQSIKKTSLIVVKKLLAADKDLESKYLDAVMKDLQS